MWLSPCCANARAHVIERHIRSANTVHPIELQDAPAAVLRDIRAGRQAIQKEHRAFTCFDCGYVGNAQCQVTYRAPFDLHGENRARFDVYGRRWLGRPLQPLVDSHPRVRDDELIAEGVGLKGPLNIEHGGEDHFSGGSRSFAKVNGVGRCTLIISGCEQRDNRDAHRPTEQDGSHDETHLSDDFNETMWETPLSGKISLGCPGRTYRFQRRASKVEAISVNRRKFVTCCVDRTRITVESFVCERNLCTIYTNADYSAGRIT